MTLAYTNFASGALSTTAQDTLYTVPADKTASVRVQVVNTGGQAAKVNIYCNGIQKGPRNMELGGYYDWDYKTFEVGEGDLIQGDATSTLVKYTITGILRG